MTQDAIEKVAQTILYKLQCGRLFTAPGKTLAEIDANIANARGIVVAALKEAIDKDAAH